MRSGVAKLARLTIATTAIALIPAAPAIARRPRDGHFTRLTISSAQVCQFSFIHHVRRSPKGWWVRFGARIGCSQSAGRLELGGNLASWGSLKFCSSCGKGWYVTSALTKPKYAHTPGRRRLTVTGNYFERKRSRHEVWVTFAVQPVGAGLNGFHDTNTKKCQIQSGDFYSCDGFSSTFR